MKRIILSRRAAAFLIFSRTAGMGVTCQAMDKRRRMQLDGVGRTKPFTNRTRKSISSS
jgi:hypothetical protein